MEAATRPSWRTWWWRWVQQWTLLTALFNVFIYIFKPCLGGQSGHLDGVAAGLQHGPQQPGRRDPEALQQPTPSHDGEEARRAPVPPARGDPELSSHLLWWKFKGQKFVPFALCTNFILPEIHPGTNSFFNCLVNNNGKHWSKFYNFFGPLIFLLRSCGFFSV